MGRMAKSFENGGEDAEVFLRPFGSKRPEVERAWGEAVALSPRGE